MQGKLVVMLAALVTVQGSVWDNVKDVAGDVGGFFEDTFNDVKSLWADNQKDLEKQVSRVQGLLTVAEEKDAELRAKASDTQKAALDQVKTWKADVDAFATKVKNDDGKNIEKNVATWKSKLTTMFQDGNLSTLVPLINGGSLVVSSFLALTAALALHLLLAH